MATSRNHRFRAVSDDRVEGERTTGCACHGLARVREHRVERRVGPRTTASAMSLTDSALPGDLNVYSPPHCDDTRRPRRSQFEVLADGLVCEDLYVAHIRGLEHTGVSIITEDIKVIVDTPIAAAESERS